MLVGDFGTDAEPAIPLLIAALGTGDDIIIGHAAIALGEIHQRPEVCVPALMPLLSSPSISTRQKPLVVLGAFGLAATSAVPAITACLTDTDPWVRMQAGKILKEMAPEAARKAGMK
jgi:HEAT repeat protein